MDGLAKRRIIRAGTEVTIRWSASEAYSCTFVRWAPMRRGCGGEKTDHIEVGAVVYSNWLFTINGQSSLDRGLKFGQHRVRPYHDLYWTHKDAMYNTNPIKRPSLVEVRRKLKQLDNRPVPTPKAKEEKWMGLSYDFLAVNMNDFTEVK